MRIISVVCVFLGLLSGPSLEGGSPKLSAPTYFISVRARTCDPTEVRFSGASNLPAGAKLAIKVSDANQDAWQDYSENVYTLVDTEGFFEGVVHPKSGTEFHRNLTLIADFSTYQPKQNEDVLATTGPRGENLGGLKNPQVYQMSGSYFLLQALDRVPFCGEGLKPEPH
jgi:hypothetical protein